MIYLLSRPLQNGTFFPIPASGSNFNPRNILYIPVVEIFAFLELEQNLPFFKGLVSLKRNGFCFSFIFLTGLTGFLGLYYLFSQ